MNVTSSESAVMMFKIELTHDTSRTPMFNAGTAGLRISFVSIDRNRGGGTLPVFPIAGNFFRKSFRPGCSEIPDDGYWSCRLGSIRCGPSLVCESISVAIARKDVNH